MRAEHGREFDDVGGDDEIEHAGVVAQRNVQARIHVAVAAGRRIHRVRKHGARAGDRRIDMQVRDLQAVGRDELVEKLRVSVLPTYLFGHSMGSFIVQDYIQRYTEHVNKVILCGTNGPNRLMIGVGYFLARLLVNKKNRKKPSKFLRNLMLGPYTSAIKNHKTKTDWLSVNEDNVRRYNEDPKCGFLYESKKSFYREFLKGLNRLHKPKFMRKIRPDMSILLIAGAEDPVGNKTKGVLKLAKLYKHLGIKDVQTIIYPNMRHEVLNETDNAKVYQDILKFLQEEHPKAEAMIK